MCYSLVVTLNQGKRKVCVQIDCDIDFSSEAIQPCKTQGGPSCLVAYLRLRTFVERCFHNTANKKPLSVKIILFLDLIFKGKWYSYNDLCSLENWILIS